MPFPPAVAGEPIRWLGMGIYPQELPIIGASFVLMVGLEPPWFGCRHLSPESAGLDSRAPAR